jgi:hypothetical protein
MVCIFLFIFSLLFFIAWFAQREKPPWGAEPGFELGPAIQQASALPIVKFIRDVLFQIYSG